jgi:hypothetical protein
MWVIKGALFGVLAFALCTVVYLYLVLGPGRANVATDLNIVAAYTLWRPLYWVAFAMMLVIGCALTHHFKH